MSPKMQERNILHGVEVLKDAVSESSMPAFRTFPEGSLLCGGSVGAR
jgi:hypothetical protein